MSGYRANCGFGVLPRTDTDSVGMIPAQFDVYNSDPSKSQLNQLNKRFGAGIELSINRNRNNNYLQDIGYREFTTATSGMYDLDFTVSGAFVPEMSSWLEYLMMSPSVEINKTSQFGTYSGGVWSEQVNPQPNDQGYVRNGTSGSYTYATSPIIYSDFANYKAKTNLATNETTMPQSPTLNQVVKFTGTTTQNYVNGHYYRCTDVGDSEANPAVPPTWKDLGTEYKGTC